MESKPAIKWELKKTKQAQTKEIESLQSRIHRLEKLTQQTDKRIQATKLQANRASLQKLSHDKQVEQVMNPPPSSEKPVQQTSR
jgi:outer membrane murein-binding lipoprotein Lpp